MDFGFFDATAAVPPEGSLGYGTVVRYNVENQAIPSYRYRINISANMVWPLLKDQYTKPEKAACSLNMAGLILHELGVSHCPPIRHRKRLTPCCMIVKHAARVMSAFMMASYDWNHDPRLAGFHSDLTQLPQNILDLLRALGQRFGKNFLIDFETRIAPLL